MSKFKILETGENSGINWQKITHDTNGNPRYIIYFEQFLKPNQFELDQALKNAAAIGGKKCKSKLHSEWIVLSSYNIREACAQILDIVREYTEKEITDAISHKTAYLSFEKNKYNYCTYVNKEMSNKDLIDGFKGQTLNLGHLEDDLQKCIECTIGYALTRDIAIKFCKGFKQWVLNDDNNKNAPDKLFYTVKDAIESLKIRKTLTVKYRGLHLGSSP